MQNCSPRSHIIDSRFYSGGYSTPESRRIFCDLYRYQRWLDVEVALAESEAELDLIPPEAASDIRKTARINLLDLNFIKEQLALTSHSLMPLLGALSKVCPEKSRRYIHYGATTQDIQDTAQSMEIRDVLDIIERDTALIVSRLADLVQSYEDMVTIGRSHTQHALPMTMGLKIAGWLDELLRSVERFQEVRSRVIVSQLFGGVGTMDAFGERGFEVLELFSDRLGLEAPAASWHASRDRIAEFLNTLAVAAGTFARMADEIRCLARNETGEMEEPFHSGKIGSSTMPHKRNPELCEQVVVLSRLIKANAVTGMDGLVNEHERDYRSVRLEWVAVADSSMFFCAILSMMRHILGNLIIHADMVNRNVQEAAPYICSEALMFHLGARIGKDRAHRLIYEAAMKAADTHKSYVDYLMDEPEIKEIFERDSIEDVMQPGNHVGLSMEISRRVIDSAQKWIQGASVSHGERRCPLAVTDGRCSVTV